MVEHEFPYVLATIGLFYLGWKKAAKPLSAYLDKEIDVYDLIFLHLLKKLMFLYLIYLGL